MLRAFTLLCVLLFPLCSVSLADNTLKHSISATATQTDNKINVDITLTDTGKTEIVNGKPMPVTETENMKSYLFEGTGATMVMGGANSSTKSIANVDEIDSGTRMDVLSIKGTNTALIIVRIIDHGAIIWADSKTIDVTVKAASDGK
jgi:hypothetical protein